MKYRWPPSVPLPPQKKVEDRLLHHLSLRSRPAEPKMLYKELAEDLGLTLEQRLVRLPDFDENAWENLVRRARQRLVTQGLLDNSQYGLWSLTEDGRIRAKGVTAEDLGL